MIIEDDIESQEMLTHVLLPVAHDEDALATATALEPYGPKKVTALHVVEKWGGVPAYHDDHGLEARVAELPRPGLDKVDLDEYIHNTYCC